jgi:hypothetical protein
MSIGEEQRLRSEIAFIEQRYDGHYPKSIWAVLEIYQRELAECLAKKDAAPSTGAAQQ